MSTKKEKKKIKKMLDFVIWICYNGMRNCVFEDTVDKRG